MEMLPPAIAIPSEGVDDDDQSVTSAALGIASSATSFSEHSGASHAAAPCHVLLALDDEAEAGLDEALHKIAAATDFTVEAHRLDLVGVCSDCD